MPLTREAISNITALLTWVAPIGDHADSPQSKT
jgi:hypothetical protein